jgi:DNA mismatch endonuclease (patch repair protein)
MRGNRRSDTRPERAVRSALHRRGIRFRLSVRPETDLSCSADMVVRRARLAIFVDGCFWHGCPEHGTKPTTNSHYWDAKITRNVERDIRNNSLLTTRGWTVVRVWEHEDPEQVADRIVELMSGCESAR